MRTTITILLLVLTTILLTLPAQAQELTTDAWMAFVSHISDGSIVLVRPDGTEEQTILEGEQPAWSADGTRLAFVADGDIFLANADGSDVTRLTTGMHPAWSPDGTQLAYVLWPGPPFNDDPRIFIINADGSDNRMLVEHATYPSWSPDGTALAYTMIPVSVFNDASGTLTWDIGRINVDGTGETNLTNNPERYDTMPSWSPDGAHIALVTEMAAVDGSPMYHLATINADGGDYTRLTFESVLIDAPTWSPDGTHIAFVAANLNPDFYLYVMEADGSNRRQVTETQAFMPAWGGDRTDLAPTPDPPTESPAADGKIAFAGAIENQDRYDIFTINPDGTGLTTLTRNPGSSDTCPAWSPDGARIVFVSERDSNQELYVMNADGTEQTRLTNHPAADDWPAWSPDGERIAFSSDRDGQYHLYVLDVDSPDDPVRLTGQEHQETDAAWSPDGTRIVFSVQDGATSNLALLTLADGSLATLANTDGAQWPEWSPDGERIAFMAQQGRPYTIQTIAPDGTGLTTISANPAGDWFPTWSPDGTRMVMLSYRDNGTEQIYVMNADGSSVRKLTDMSSATFPAWSPALTDDGPGTPDGEGFQIWLPLVQR